MIPETFRTDILKEEADANQVLVENANSETGSFALLFLSLMEISERSGMCFITVLHPVRPLNPRPMREDKEVQTETLTIKARPMANGYVKAKTGDATTEAVYNDWYKNVGTDCICNRIRGSSKSSIKR